MSGGGAGREPGTRPLAGARVFEFMHPAIVTCAASTLLDELAERMATGSIHCVVILPGVGDEGGGPGWGVATDLEHGTPHLLVSALGRDRPVGIVSTLDVARCLSPGVEALVAALRDGRTGDGAGTV